MHTGICNICKDVTCIIFTQGCPFSATSLILVKPGHVIPFSFSPYFLNCTLKPVSQMLQIWELMFRSTQPQAWKPFFDSVFCSISCIFVLNGKFLNSIKASCDCLVWSVWATVNDTNCRNFPHPMQKPALQQHFTEIICKQTIGLDSVQSQTRSVCSTCSVIWNVFVFRETLCFDPQALCTSTTSHHST